jgi:pyruvate dehydrogenase E2 component (dihydrolipoamide acetyltransferase)
VKQVGETINKGDVLAEIETDKATVEVESSASGVVLQLIAEQGSMVPVNAPIAVVGQAGEGEKVERTVGSLKWKVESGRKACASIPPTPAPVAQASAPAESGPVKASPLARKIARDKNINLASIQGTGPWRTRRPQGCGSCAFSGVDRPQTVDLRRQIRAPITNVNYQSRMMTPSFKPQNCAKPSGVDLLNRSRPSRTSMSRMNTRWKRSWRCASRSTRILPEDEKVSVNDFIIKAVALTLRQFPNLNATIKGNEVIQFGHVNVSVAVTVPGGLMTVVVKDADQKGLRQISGEIKSMAARARDGKVKPEDVDGSTFSTSNLGMYDVEEFIAIVNPPEAAILAISSAREVPVVENGEIESGLAHESDHLR